MLRMRGLLIASIVLAALAGGIYWSNKHEEAEAKKPSAGEPPKILMLPSAELQKFEIRKIGVAPVIVDHISGQWQMTAPRPLATFLGPVGEVITALASVTADRLVEDKAEDLSELGLSSPALDIIATRKDGKTSELLIGEETPTGRSYFAKLAGDPRIFTISSSTRASFDKTWNDFRDKHLMTFDQNKVTGIEMNAKGEDFAFGKNNQNEWQIVKPGPMRADGGQFSDLISALSSATMETTGAEDEGKKAGEAFASGSLFAAAKVSDSSGTQELTIRKGKDQSYYAKSSVVAGAYKVPASLAEGLNKSESDFRNKKLFDFGWDNPIKIDVRDGANRAIYDRSGEKWFLAGKRMDTATMSDAIAKLRDTAATAFPDKGFTASVLDIAVTSSDGKRVETIDISKSGDGYIARRENEPGLYRLDAAVVAEFQKALSAVKPAAPQPSPANAKKK
jgi:hypothetical protein